MQKNQNAYTLLVGVQVGAWKNHSELSSKSEGVPPCDLVFHI